MDWFEKLTGFRETSYEDTRGKLEVEGGRLRSTVNGASYGIGALELVSLQALRERAKAASAPPGRLKVSVVTGDVRRMHHSPDNASALFQVASQFNLLEMVSPDVTPEQGVTRYQGDPTQGPACAIAAGAATIYRNYFAPAGESLGQTAKRQIDGLADLGEALSRSLSMPVSSLWKMQNGYALATRSGLDAIAKHLGTLDAEQLDMMRGKLRVRANIIDLPNRIDLIPGEIVEYHHPGYYQTAPRTQAVARQRDEDGYYKLCAKCLKKLPDVVWNGCDMCESAGAAFSTMEAKRRRDAGENLWIERRR